MTTPQHQSLEAIRRAYPSPSRGDDPRPPGAYCVGMAVMLAHHAWDAADHTFPGESEIAHCLADLNPALDIPAPGFTGTEGEMDVEATLAYAFAEDITTANDASDFETAWEIVGRALAYPEAVSGSTPA